MSQPPNPYAAPAAQPVYAPIFGNEPQYVTAERSYRFLNYIVDLFAVYGLLYIALRVMAVVGHPLHKGETVGLYLLWGGLELIYYTGMELSCGRTVGKWITGTKAVASDGRPLGFGKALGRSLCRLIPFDALVALGGRPFHDSIPETKVVRTRGKGAVILPPPPGLEMRRPPAPVRPPFNPR